VNSVKYLYEGSCLTDNNLSCVACQHRSIQVRIYVRDRPFNLRGGYGFFFLSVIFFPEFNIRLYDKNSESDFFFFLHQNQNIFSATLGIRIFLFNIIQKTDKYPQHVCFVINTSWSPNTIRYSSLGLRSCMFYDDFSTSCYDVNTSLGNILVVISYYFVDIRV
jgi:hypothetical protein